MYFLDRVHSPHNLPIGVLSELALPRECLKMMQFIKLDVWECSVNIS